MTHPIDRNGYAAVWYLIWYLISMPALNLQFTEEEMNDLRETAEREGRSLKKLAHDVVVQAASSRKHLVEDAAAQVARISAGLNERLTQE